MAASRIRAATAFKSLTGRLVAKEIPMDSLFLELPERELKPRHRGLTMTIDNGIAHGAFADEIIRRRPTSTWSSSAGVRPW